MTEKKTYPFYIKSTAVLLSLILFIFILYILQDILVPFAFAGLIAILLNPLNNRIERTGLPRTLCIILTILFALGLFSLLMYFLSSQIMSFGDMLPELKKRFGIILDQAQGWIRHTFGVSTRKQVAMVNEALNNSKQYLGQTLGSLIGIVGIVVLIPIYVFMLLFYKPLIINFIFEVFKEKHAQKVDEILGETKGAVQSYIFGLLIETAIVATLNALALIILGVKYAILIGVIGGILNMLPYIGGIIAIALPILMSLVTKEGLTTPVAILCSYLLIQFIDNNILVPRIVSSKVQINALISIIIVLMGGALWGVSGMFLSIPFIAILKIIFDRIDELKPWGKLLGDTMPDQHKVTSWRQKLNRLKGKRAAIAATKQPEA
ncbi:AI-2E family transporter [Chitinophagaceae bacterium MMS25-I14]